MWTASEDFNRQTLFLVDEEQIFSLLFFVALHFAKLHRAFSAHTSLSNATLVRITGRIFSQIFPFFSSFLV